MFLLKSLILVGLSFFVSASIILPPPTGNVSASCTVSDYSQVASAVSGCTNIVFNSFTVPSGKSLSLTLKDYTTLTLRGAIVFDVGYNDMWLIEISGNHITVIGQTGHVLHGQGERYWDGHGGGGGVKKPKLLRIINVNNGVFKNIFLKNCPTFCTGVERTTGLNIDGWTVDCSAGNDPKHIAKNTDGIGISGSKDIVITNAVINNQDQCVYVNQGYNMVFSRIRCIGSNGLCATAGFGINNYEENTVRNITFKNCVVEKGLWGVMLIAISGSGPGEISDVTYQNIQLNQVTQQGIWIEMNYDFGRGTQINNNIEIKNFRVSNVFGTVGNNARAVNIIAGSKVHDWYWSNINITGAGRPNSCNYQPNGFRC